MNSDDEDDEDAEEEEAGPLVATKADPDGTKANVWPTRSALAAMERSFMVS